MIPFVVVPMLNEVASIAATCRSLGFPGGPATSGAVLVLVDNGSTDGTIEVAESIRTSCGDDRMVVVHESCRGYVPARVAGVHAVFSEAERLQFPPDRVLVLQADADTVYERGYVHAMVEAANAEGRGVLLEGASIPPPRDQDTCRLFRELEGWVDGTLPMAGEELDVVVDDKVSGYRLSDYEAWGGHIREFREADGPDELFAETTRLFIRARLRSGARRFRVENALATTSSRRILEDPSLAFATAGFPREKSWVRDWHRTYSGARSLADFTVDNLDGLVDVIATRRRHLSALFQLLPQMVDSTMATWNDSRSRSSSTGPQRPRTEEDSRTFQSAGEMLQDALRKAGIG